MYHLIPYLVITSDVDLDMTTSLFTLDGNFDYVSEIENTDLHKYFVQCPYIWKFDYFDTIDTDPDYFFPPRGMNPLNITELGQVKWDIFYANILKQTHKGLLVGLPDPQTVHDNQLQLWSMLERLFPCVDYDAIAFKIEFDNPIIVKAGETFSFTPKVKVKR